MSSPRTISQGATILVTGANGYIASHVINRLLADGYKVHGTVRDEKPWLDEHFTTQYGEDSYKSIVVPTLADENAIAAAVKGVHGVVHVASNMSWSNDPNVVISDTISMAINVLKAAAQSDSVKRVVMTSSAVASFPRTVEKPSDGDFEVDTNTWNEASVKAAWDPNSPEISKSSNVYSASKVEAERAAWKWVAENKPKFTFNTVLPNMNVGKILFPQHQRGSMAATRLLLSGNDIMTKVVPAGQWWVNVEDDARLHAIALLDANVQSERIFACAAPFTWTQIYQTFQELQPENDKIPNAPKDEGPTLIKVKPSARAEQLIQKFYGRDGWVSLKESLADGIADISNVK
ncbi:NAD dependent epimerase/dehydratase [Talaromyces proteolyticus]|uniref:NAD dependent epimerase/dehydratase n=1 Tax=Talaromyces proteolyticus TaxID=1131652 RepID=A0AAD4PYL8_9EURO|nr:NAD dependent epimerase/dehydratase [Talaromyces proteolyticus]KAH8701660.1 NAD dependent epimerase/dehydratase [Talaromyces proteolyticus]